MAQLQTMTCMIVSLVLNKNAIFQSKKVPIPIQNGNILSTSSAFALLLLCKALFSSCIDCGFCHQLLVLDC